MGSIHGEVLCTLVAGIIPRILHRSVQRRETVLNTAVVHDLADVAVVGDDQV